MASRYLLVPLLAFVALSAWALSSAVGSSPDDDYHLTSIWCGQGVESGVCEQGPAADERRVPEPLPSAPGCYAFNSTASGDCQSRYFSPESEKLVTTDRGNFTGDYPPVFYFTMNMLVGDDISKSVLVMRAFNAALFVGLTAALYWLLPRGRRTMLALGTAVALVPLGVFIIPSVNPSSWAVISSALVFPAVLGYFEATGRRRYALAGVALVATLVGAGARADAAVYAAIATVLAVLLGASWRTGVWRLLPFPFLLCVACVLGYRASGQTEAATVGFDGSETPALNLPDQIGHNLLNVPELWAGVLGFWGLGWLDTPMPSMVWVINLATFGAVLYLGLRQTSLRKGLAVLAVLGAAWVLPTVVLVQSGVLVGAEVQPRYVLPLLVVVAQVALFRVAPRRMELSRFQLTTVAVALTLTNAIALHFNIRRYVTGTDVFAFNLDAGREWWWEFGVSPMSIWLIGTVAFGAAMVLCLRALADSDLPVAVESPTVPRVPALERPLVSSSV